MIDRAEVKVLPPLLLLPILGAQALLWNFAPLRILPGYVAPPLAVAVVAGSIALVILAAREIARAETAFDARKATTALVDSGVFRFTRNPVYLSMVLLVIGVGLMLNSFWSLLLAVPTGSALCLTAIRPEERYLEAKFGDAYRAYRAAAPRWFSFRRVLAVF
jgi:protein-S-isoprenylcysteine O-methyltransferase Ste14